MNENDLNNNNSIAEVVVQIKQLAEQSRNRIVQSVNAELLHTYWKIGCIIIEEEQKGKHRAGYGKHLITELSKRLSKELGKGFSRSNLQNMRNFYQICQTVSGKLSWSHFCELLSISDPDKRSFYEKECISNKIFASRYVHYIPDKDVLIRQLEYVLKQES